MDLVMRKPVFGVSDKVRFKLACSASLDMILSKKQITKALISLHRLVCACVVPKPLKTGFLASRPKCYTLQNISL